MAEKYAKLHAWKFGLACGIITAACVFLTVILGIFGWFPEYVTLADKWLASIYGLLGYKISFFGAIVGTIFAFLDTFVFVWIFVLIYNKLIS